MTALRSNGVEALKYQKMTLVWPPPTRPHASAPTIANTLKNA